ncbi:hypothetical protein [Armatimonas sp.]|uniref:hypothetical protein n=1 Tax=Armatimonas sp. TaxID=1872638 RepID=UPI00374DEDDD
MTTQESRTYLDIRGIAVHKLPQVNGEKITGVTAGRIVAYWPRESEAFAPPDFLYNGPLRPVGGDNFIPAMIVASWSTSAEGSECPCANLRLFLDPGNQQDAVAQGMEGRSSCQYSEVPAQGCWTWIPKA